MVNRPGGVTSLGYAYRCLVYLSFLSVVSSLAGMPIEPQANNNNK